MTVAQATAGVSADVDEVHLDLLSQRLTRVFPGLSDSDVRQCAERAYRDLDGAPIREFVSVLAERRARSLCRQRLAAHT